MVSSSEVRAGTVSFDWLFTSAPKFTGGDHGSNTLDRTDVHPARIACVAHRIVALRIKHDEADRLARALARATGETLTEAVVVALRERLDRVVSPPLAMSRCCSQALPSPGQMSEASCNAAAVLQPAAPPTYLARGFRPSLTR